VGVASIDLTLYAIVDISVEEVAPIGEFISQVIEGGVTCLQVRCKQASTRRVFDFTRRVLEAADRTGVPVIVNDRIDVALAAGAQGVHLGAEDMPVALARKVCGKDMIIGATVRDVLAGREAQRAGADYLGVGPAFATSIKPDLIPIQPEVISAIHQEISLPIVAIGGINDMNAAIPLEHGADGVAVISALRQSKSPKEAASRLRAAIDKAKKR
jgi:thiamine-phosphate pyrophosphorylase